MIPVLESLLPVFLLVALGWSLRRFEVVPREKWEGIELLGFWVLFPALLFHALTATDLGAVAVDAMVLSYVGAMAVQFLLLFLLNLARRRWLAMDGPSFSSVFQTSTRWNAFIALAILDKYGDAEGLAAVALIMALTVIPLNVINIVVVAGCAARPGSGWRQVLIATARNPMIIGVFAGLSVSLLDIPIYEPLRVTVDVIGRSGLAIGLLTVGAGLRIRSIFQPRADMWFGVVGRMIVFPLLVLAMASWTGLSGVALVAAVACAAVPTAMNGYLIARRMGGDAELYATTSAAQTLLGLVSIPLFLWYAIGVA